MSLNSKVFETYKNYKFIICGILVIIPQPLFAPVFEERRTIFAPAARILPTPNRKEPSLGETFAAAFQTDNLVGSALRDTRVPRALGFDAEQYEDYFGAPIEPDFNYWEQIVGTKYEGHFRSLAGTRSTTEMDARKRDIDAQEKNRDILARSGG